MRYLILGLALTLVAPLFAAPVPAQSALPEFASARAIFFQARAGDAKATEQALEQFERMTKAQPDQPLYRAYYGSAYCLKARDGWFPFSKLANAEKGLDLMTKAVSALGPEHDQLLTDGVAVSLEVRLVAASTYRSMPSMFNRAQQGKDTLADLLASPLLPASPATFRATVYLEAARSAQKDGDQALLEANVKKAAEAAPQSDAAQKARELLAKPGA